MKTHPYNHSKLLQFRTPARASRTHRFANTGATALLSRSPLSPKTQQLLVPQSKPDRSLYHLLRHNVGPSKTLEAPLMAADFYINPLSWSATNLVSVGLGNSLCIWDGNNDTFFEFVGIGETPGEVTSASWLHSGTHLAIGYANGDIQLWDIEYHKLLHLLGGLHTFHKDKINCLAWNDRLLSSGSRDKTIRHFDVRSATPHAGQQPGTAKNLGHWQEVCGLSWNPHHLGHVASAKLASGGNDNQVLIWELRMPNQPVYRLAEHMAAVKAIAWSELDSQLLITGGGRDDRSLKIWNLRQSAASATARRLQSKHASGAGLSGTMLLTTGLASTNTILTDSQICNLYWLPTNNVISTQGFSANNLSAWAYPEMIRMVDFEGHGDRTLYASIEPVRRAEIVTASPDRTLKFWNLDGIPSSVAGQEQEARSGSGRNGLMDELDRISSSISIR